MKQQIQRLVSIQAEGSMEPTNNKIWWNVSYYMWDFGQGILPPWIFLSSYIIPTQQPFLFFFFLKSEHY